MNGLFIVLALIFVFLIDVGLAFIVQLGWNAFAVQFLPFLAALTVALIISSFMSRARS